jgi:hypothetical protein
MENIKSGAEYAQLLINQIIENEKEVPTGEQLPINLLTYWCEEIESHAEITYHEYLTGKRDHFSFNEDEFRLLFDKAGMRYTGDVLDGLVEKEMVQVSIREDGEIVYSATEKGKQTLKDNGIE